MDPDADMEVFGSRGSMVFPSQAMLQYETAIQQARQEREEEEERAREAEEEEVEDEQEEAPASPEEAPASPEKDEEEPASPEEEPASPEEEPASKKMRPPAGVEILTKRRVNTKKAYGSKETNQSLQSALNNLAGFYIYYLKNGGKLLGLKSKRQGQTLTISLDEEIVARANPAQKKILQQARTSVRTHVLKPREWRGKKKEKNKLSKVNPADSGFMDSVLFVSNNKISQMVIDLIWKSRVYLLEEIGLPSDFNLEKKDFDVLRCVTESSSLVSEILRNELMLYLEFSCASDSPRQFYYQALDIESFTNSTLRHIKMAMKNVHKLPLNYIEEVFEAKEFSRYIEIRSREEWDLMYRQSIECRFANTIDEKVLDKFVRGLIALGDEKSLFLHFSITMIYNTLVRPQVPLMCTFRQFSFDGENMHLNSDTEKNCKFRNYQRVLLLDGSNVFMSPHLSLALLHLKWNLSKKKINLDSKISEMCGVHDLGWLFRSRFNKLFPGHPTVYTLYSVRKTAVTIALGSFVNMSRDLVKKRGRWFESLKKAVAEVRKSRSSFNRYDLIYTSIEDLMVAKVMVGRAPDTLKNPPLIDYLLTMDTSGFIQLKLTEKVYQLAIMLALIHGTDSCIKSNWILKRIKKKVDPKVLAKRLKNEAIFKPDRIRGETEAQCLIRGVHFFYYEKETKTFRRRWAEVKSEVVDLDADFDDDFDFDVDVDVDDADEETELEKTDRLLRLKIDEMETYHKEMLETISMVDSLIKPAVTIEDTLTRYEELWNEGSEFAGLSAFKNLPLYNIRSLLLHVSKMDIDAELKKQSRSFYNRFYQMERVMRVCEEISYDVNELKNYAVRNGIVMKLKRKRKKENIEESANIQETQVREFRVSLSSISNDIFPRIDASISRKPTTRDDEETKEDELPESWHVLTLALREHPKRMVDFLQASGVEVTTEEKAFCKSKRKSKAALDTYTNLFNRLVSRVRYLYSNRNQVILHEILVQFSVPRIGTKGPILEKKLKTLVKD